LHASEEKEKICDEHRRNILGDLIERTNPFVYPFIIEFALIGASVAYLMSNHIGKRSIFYNQLFFFVVILTAASIDQEKFYTPVPFQKHSKFEIKITAIIFNN
jgi:hypothetical protein